MHGIRQQVATVRTRQQLQWIGQCLAWGLVVGGLAGCVIGALMIARIIPSTEWIWLAASLIGGPALGLTASLLLPRSLHGAAEEIDARYGLKDRVVTAWTFLARTARSPFQDLQIADTDLHLKGVDPATVVPYRAPRSLAAGVALSAVALALTLFAPAPEQAIASTTVNPVVISQADRAEEELKKLEEFNREDQDPDIEELLKQLSETLKEMKEPGLDPREALAKLSEMETMLQAKQEKLADPLAESQLQQIGEALALAESLASAGAAMSQKDFDKAAEELEKQELPKLDRQTERSLTEKLGALEQRDGSGMKQGVREAAGQIREGISSGRNSKFQDGMKALAGECRSQSRKNRLADLLRKQCQCLSECKGECESECNSQSQGNKKGGQKPGRGASGNDAGEATAMLKSKQDMNIKGQHSDQGDSEVETTTAPEQQQEAVRQYREKAEKYEQLSESVLDSEPIPLGHRQTIRKYFELIRPTGSEVDTVKQQTQE